MRLAALALITLVQLNTSIPNQLQADQPLNDVAKESRELTDRYLDRHQRDEEINALHDIEDAIIFDSLREGDD